MKIIKIMSSSVGAHQSGHNYGYYPYVLAGVGSIIWPLSWIYANEHKINMSQTTMIRGFTSLVANYLICKISCFDVSFSHKQSLKYLIIRSIILALTSIFVGASQFILPLSIVHTIISSSTLFIFIIDYLVNGIKINIKQGVGITIGMIGMILSCNGNLIITWINPSYKYQTKFQNYITDNIYVISIFTISMIAMMAAWGYAMVITKSLLYNVFQINYLLGVVNIFVGATLYQFLPREQTKQHFVNQYDPYHFYMTILYTGIPLIFDQWLLVAAMMMTKDTGVVSMIYFNSVVVGYLISVFRYGQRPNMVTNLGVALLAIGLYQTLFNTKTQNDYDLQSVSEGADNQDGTFKRKYQQENFLAVIKQELGESNQNSDVRTN